MFSETILREVKKTLMINTEGISHFRERRTNVGRQKREGAVREVVIGPGNASAVETKLGWSYKEVVVKGIY